MSASAAKASEDSTAASEQVAITKASEASQSAVDSATYAQESKLSAEASETSNQSSTVQATIATEAKDEVIVMRDEVITLEQASEDSAELSKNWAINMSGLVDGEDYSSKHYANESKRYSDNIGIAAEDADLLVERLRVSQQWGIVIDSLNQEQE